MIENKPIRILIVGMHDKIGGVETFLINYYRNIDREKFQFDFISIYDKLCFEDEILQMGGRVYKICSEKRNPIRYCKQLEGIIRENQYKIIHINMLSAANILPIIVSKKQKVKHIIVHSHSSDTPSGILRKILNAINKPFLCLATDFFACSKLAGKWLLGEKNLKKHELIIINNAIDIERYKYNPDIRYRIRKKLNLKDEYVMGHVGRFSYPKNHEFLIDIFYNYIIQNNKDNVILLLIGEGELEEKIKEKVKKLHIEEKVKFLGVTKSVEDYLQAMDIFLLPSRFEGLPVVGIEAQASGLNCLFSDTITRELKITKNVEFLPITDTKPWEKYILNIKDYNRNDAILEVEKSNYNIKKEAIKLQNIYYNILHKER